MHTEENVDLGPFNTLRLHEPARFLITIRSEKDLAEYREDEQLHSLPYFILGGGSNVLFSKPFEGVVLKNEIEGFSVREDTDEEVVWEIGGGENWHETVRKSAAAGLHGIEALALIPGTVGAAPVQNIAAYGQNFSDAFVSLDAVSMQTGDSRVFTKEDLNFSYRNSALKQRGEYFVTRVRLRLVKTLDAPPEYVSTGTRKDSIFAELSAHAKEPYTPMDVFTAVVNIRTRKLLDPAIAPTAGSFFLNPVVDQEKAKELQSTVPELQTYPEEGLSYEQGSDELHKSTKVKVAVARLIEHLGWKGKRVGNCSVSPDHALLITHNGAATGRELREFVAVIQDEFKEAYGIPLTLELVVV